MRNCRELAIGDMTDVERARRAVGHKSAGSRESSSPAGRLLPVTGEEGGLEDCIAASRSRRGRLTCGGAMMDDEFGTVQEG